MPFMFVANEAFPLQTHLMKPYPYINLDHDHRVYNYRLSRARCVVENVLGILANRLQVFHTTISLEPEAVCWITLAALCLHNYLCTEAADGYIPPALVDVEDEHHNIIPGSWRNDATLQSVSADRDCNPSRNAEEQCDKLKEYFVSPVGSVSWQEDRL